MTTLVVVPARMASVRFPGKPLVEVDGEPMVVRVWRQAMEADIGPVVIATPDYAIHNAAFDAGAHVVMTGEAESGSVRAQKAAQALGGSAEAIVVVQGDMPRVSPAAIRRAIEPLRKPDTDVGTLITPLAVSELADPNAVKVLVAPLADDGWQCLWFDRKPIRPRNDTESSDWKHVGIYAWRRKALDLYCTLSPSRLETEMGLEQMRAVGAAMRIEAKAIAEPVWSVDTPDDLERLQRMSTAA